MLITQQGLHGLFNAFNTAFKMGVGAAQVHWNDVAMEVPSTAEMETYAWLGAVPQMREWVGDRVIKTLSVQGYAIVNRRFENTLVVPRTKIEDDKYGIFSPVLQQMGLDAARHPDELVFGLLASGFGTKCYDGQYFFDADRPVGQLGLSSVGSVSNVQAGDGPAWFLLDCSQPIKPLIYQNRIPYVFTALTNDGDENVFMRDEYLYGVRARCNVRFGLWQLAYSSRAPLTPDNYAAARAAMQSQVSDSGRPLNVSPTHLVHSPILERDARRLLVSGLVAQTTTGTDAVGVTNEWAGSAKMLMSPYLVAA